MYFDLVGKKEPKNLCGQSQSKYFFQTNFKKLQKNKKIKQKWIWIIISFSPQFTEMEFTCHVTYGEGSLPKILLDPFFNTQYINQWLILALRWLFSVSFWNFVVSAVYYDQPHCVKYVIMWVSSDPYIRV